MAKTPLYEVQQKRLELNEEEQESELAIGTEEAQEGIQKFIAEHGEIYMTDDDHEETLKELKTQWQRADESRPEDKLMELRYKQFMSYLHTRPDGLANVNLPIEFATIENKMADMFSQKPVVQLLPQTKEDTRKVSLLKYIWDYVWNEADTDKELFHVGLASQIFGTGWWFEGLEMETYTRFEPVLEKDGKIGKKAVRETRSFLKGKALDWRNVWIDPVYDIDVAEWCFIAETDLSYDHLVQRQYDPNYDAEALRSYLSTNTGTQNQQQGNSQSSFITPEEAKRNDVNKFTLMHYFNSRKGVYIVTDSDFKFIFRNGATPYPHGELPISALQDHLNYRSIYGRGECELLESTKYERNMIRNQVLDYVRFSNTVNIAVGSGITFEDQELIGSVARVWNFSGDLNQMQFMKPPSQDSGLFSVDEILKLDATWITGIDNNALLGSPSGTAFEARLQEQQKLKRIFMSLRLQDFFLTRVGRQRLANIQFFLPYTTGKKLLKGKLSKYRTIAIPDVEASPVMGLDKDNAPVEKGVKMKKKQGHTEFLELTPQMIQSNMDILVTTPSTTPILRDLNRAEMQELFNLILQFQNMPNNPKAQKFLAEFDPSAYVDDVAMGMGIDMQDFLPSEDDITPKKEGDMMQKIMGDLPLAPKPITGELPSLMQEPQAPAQPVQGGQIPAGM
jgi:hypothetical protein